ncbi:MAG: enoyl-CoA hydratase-related protein [Acidimicrobiia bacterium]|jgi:enoyl-CoA hydratase/carnithine racemase
MSSETPAPVLERRRDGAVEILTLNRPERRNALDGALIGALNDAFTEIASDDGVRAVVVTGAGDRAFCSGMDLKDFSSRPSDQDAIPAEGGDSDARFTIVPWDYPKPIVAAVNGAAVAGGFELLMSCDLIVAADHAVFGLAEVKRGLLPGGGGTLLATRVPMAIALEITLVGDTFDAARALEIGLVNRVVPAARVLDEAVALASRVAENGPLAVTVVKQLVRRGATEGGDAAWPTRADLRRVFESEDAREGALAFVEKRAPRWTGR